MNPTFCAVTFLAFAVIVQAAEPLTLFSPDKQIEVRVAAGAADQGRAPGFEVRFKGQQLLNGQVGLTVANQNILENSIVKASGRRASDNSYTLVFAKNNPVRDHFNELSVELESGTGAVRQVQLVFRAYDDGVAYRYVIPRQEGVDTIAITDEPGEFQFAGNPQAWPLYRENYTTSHEGRYSSTRLSELADNQLIDLPLLLQYDNGVSAAIAQAALRNYAGLYLKAEGHAPSARLRCDLSPLPGPKDVKVRSRLPLRSPWRAILIGSQPGQLIESNLIVNLNDPSVIGDTSWLQIGKTTWTWWNGPYQEPVDFTVGLNWRTSKHYIDFCASNHIAFHSIVSTTDEHPWYFQTQHGFGPAPDSDVTRARPEVEMERTAEYARSKGVGLRLWVHWKALSDRLEQAFAQYEKWGIKGLMVDFLDRDDQEMVLFAERVLQSAAQHHLHIHFHGAWQPTGLQRTYPNLFNHEAVLNLEYLKWGDQCDPDHNLTVPFTRMLAGPLDYHLGGFRAADRAHFKAQNYKPNVLGTRCHHLAMYVVYENPMPMVCDAPTAYEGQPGFDFIKDVPTSWDETRVLQADVGHSIVVARRKGSAWYLGAMTDWTPRQVKVSLRFLPPGQFEVASWADAKDSQDPNDLHYQSRLIDAGSELVLDLAGGGGQALRIQPSRDL
jgi:alpha-glucosidase